MESLLESKMLILWVNGKYLTCSAILPLFSFDRVSATLAITALCLMLFIYNSFIVRTTCRLKVKFRVRGSGREKDHNKI